MTLSVAEQRKARRDRRGPRESRRSARAEEFGGQRSQRSQRRVRGYMARPASLHIVSSVGRKTRRTHLIWSHSA